MPLPAVFASKTPAQIREDLRGMPETTVEAALRFHGDGRIESFFEMLPGMIAWHLPRGAATPPEALQDGMRLSQDLGLDSLAMMEMAFKLDDLLGVTIESTEMKDTATVGDLKELLAEKLSQEAG
jgi:acyl carrier protein